METRTDVVVVSKVSIIVGRIISVLVVLFMLMDSGMKVLKLPMVLRETGKLGFTPSAVQGMGLALLASTILYMIPHTAVLGAILISAYLGGAVAINVQSGQGVFPCFCAVLFAALAWLGLLLREGKLRMLLPLRKV